MKRGLRGILWQGPSPFDGEPILAIATPSANSKTGPMTQVWILLRDVSPLDAVRSGKDVSVCGRCPLRSPDGLSGRSCYVQVSNSPRSVWEAFHRGLYQQLEPEAFRGHAIRWGAYGDPAMLPWQLVTAINMRARAWTGYTHQWRKSFGRPFKGVFMASVETPAQETRAAELGWGTFRAGVSSGVDQGATPLCRAERFGETCLECKVCDGRPSRVYIPAHGAGRNFVPAARLARRG